VADAQPEPKPPAAPKPPPARRTALPVITQNRMFTLLILIVTGAFVASLLGLAALAFFGKEPPTTMQIKFADVCVYICMVSIGALVGLLGGRAAAPDRLEIGERR
jgi:hypothetical protein